MSSMEAQPSRTELSIDQIYDEVLSDVEFERARELHAYVLDWVLSPHNVSQHARVMFMYTCAQGKIGEAISILMSEFGDTNSTISPVEPRIWVEWANYWQRGFDPANQQRQSRSHDRIQ